jgi:hypothetical protein
MHSGQDVYSELQYDLSERQSYRKRGLTVPSIVDPTVGNVYLIP